MSYPTISAMGAMAGGLHWQRGEMERPILIVEDDFDVRDALSDILEDAGYDVVAARDGLEALEWLREGDDSPRLILLDLMMPRMDGFAFREAQRSDPRLANIPVLVLSADRQVASKSQEMGVEGFLPKPIDLDVLLDRVAHYN